MNIVRVTFTPRRHPDAPVICRQRSFLINTKDNVKAVALAKEELKNQTPNHMLRYYDMDKIIITEEVLYEI